jgi:hypothetical protein
MERCKTCKHWEAYRDDEVGALRGAGICHAAKELWQSSESEDDPRDEWMTYRRLKPEAAGVLSFVQDGSNYMARLVTMPNFGCVQHAERA